MRILIIEDSKAISLQMKHQLEGKGHKVVVAENGKQGFLLATSNHYDVFLSDIFMPHWDGYKFIEAMEVVNPSVPIIVISGSLDHKELYEKLEAYINVIAILAKPINYAKLFEHLGSLKEQSSDSVRKLGRIVCTIGPASDAPETLGKMIIAGMDVARLNFSHGTHEQHEKTLNNIRKAEEKWGKPVAVLLDLCGPKIRTGKMVGDGAKLSPGKKIRIVASPVEGNSECISTISPEVLPDLRVGDPVLLDDGLLELKVVTEGEEEVVCEVIIGGLLKSSKGINLPQTDLSLPSLTPKDKADLQWGLEHSIDYVALSFVRSAAEILEIKQLITLSGKRDIRVIAKVEKPEAVENIKDIVDAADAIMIARGDMGVELAAARVPRIQQEIIHLCWHKNKPVITATQMLDTMTYNYRPTRAEVTDVSVAVKEGTDAVMLSGETATGIDPVNVVRTMASIICEEEIYRSDRSDDLTVIDPLGKKANPAIIAASSLTMVAATMLIDLQGTLYPEISKWNRRVPNLLVTNSLHVARHAALYKNIVPIIIRDRLTRDEMVFKAIETAKEWGYISSEDILCVVEGGRHTQGGIPQLGAFQLVSINNSGLKCSI